MRLDSDNIIYPDGYYENNNTENNLNDNDNNINKFALKSINEEIPILNKLSSDEKQIAINLYNTVKKITNDNPSRELMNVRPMELQLVEEIPHRKIQSLAYSSSQLIELEKIINKLLIPSSLFCSIFLTNLKDFKILKFFSFKL